MFVEFIFLTMSLMALYAAASQRFHILMSILSLEATSLVLAIMYMISYSSTSEDYLGIIILTFAAAETASALGLLATLSRFMGSDSMNSCSFSNFNSAPMAGYHWWW